MMPACAIEMILYHGYDETGSIEISLDSSSGPWTKLTLTSPKPIGEALAEWQTLANAALPAGGWEFRIDPSGRGRVYLGATEPAWVRLSACLARILGFSSTVIADIADTQGSDVTPWGLVRELTHHDFPLPSGVAVAVTTPFDAEEAHLDTYRGGRVNAYHYGRVLEVWVDLYLRADVWDELGETSPLCLGTTAMKIWRTTDESDPWDPVEGVHSGVLTVYPFGERMVERESSGDWAWIRFRATVRDPEADEPTWPSSPTAWQRMAMAVPYGYAIYYLARIRGIPTLFCEVLGDAIAPDDYTLDASLVIDRTSPLGPFNELDAAVAKAFDAELRLLETDTVRAYFTRPERYTFLTAPLAHDDTEAHVESTHEWEGLSSFYIADSAFQFSARTADTFEGLDGSVWGAARSYPRGAMVTDGPMEWLDREIELLAVGLDPLGSYLQGADILEDAVKLWRGYIAERPIRDGTEWSIVASDQIRKLTNPLGVAASGRAVWTEDDDAVVEVPVEMTIAIKAELQPTSNSILDVVVRPFSTYTQGATARLSELRAAILTALTAAATDAQVTGFSWRKVAAGNDQHYYDLLIQFDPDAGDTQFEVLYTAVSHGHGLFLAVNYANIHATPVNGGASNELRQLWVIQIGRVTGVSLSVILEDGDPEALPEQGMVLLSAQGRVDYARYTRLDVDALDASRVHLALDQADRILGAELDAILAGERQDVAVRFLWTDSGGIADVARRAIVSTGDAIHGAYDTLPKGQGLALPEIDSDSFDDVLGGALFADLTFTLQVDAGVSIEQLLGGFLRLARIGLTTRRSSDGTQIAIAAVDLGSVDSGVPVATITEDVLAFVPGRRPVRVLGAYQVPQQIVCKVREAPIDDQPAAETAVTFKSRHLVEWTRLKWELDIHGLAREELVRVGRGLARSWFRGGETRQVVELDLPISIDAQAGDVVELDLPDPALWDYAQGIAGLAGLARVLGSRIDLTSGVQAVRVAADGVSTAAPMSPSLPIYAVNGTATNPDSIDVEDAHHDLLVAAMDGAATFKVIAYEPGQDLPYFYTINGISLPGGGVCRLAVSFTHTSGITLTTDFRITWPITASCTDNQERYLHNDQRTQWS